MFAKYPNHLVTIVSKKVPEAIQKNLFPDDESLQKTLVHSAGTLTEDGVILILQSIFPVRNKIN